MSSVQDVERAELAECGEGGLQRKRGISHVSNWRDFLTHGRKVLLLLWRSSGGKKVEHQKTMPKRGIRGRMIRILRGNFGVGVREKGVWGQRQLGWIFCLSATGGGKTGKKWEPGRRERRQYSYLSRGQSSCEDRR